MWTPVRFLKKEDIALALNGNVAVIYDVLSTYLSDNFIIHVGYFGGTVKTEAVCFKYSCEHELNKCMFACILCYL